MDAHVVWQRGLSFTGTANSGFSVPLGGKSTAGGDSDGFRPMELLAISLAGCTAMDVISILQKKKQVVSGFEVRVYTKRAHEYPKVYTHTRVEYLIEGKKVDPVAVERAIELSFTKYCPVQAMLAESVEIEHSYQITETGSPA